MLAELIDTIQSLTALIEEETDKLVSPARHADLGELVEAKIRLTAALETRLVRMARETPGWAEALSAEDRERLASSIQVLIDASLVNADLLERQIALSTELMGAVAAEVQRLVGARGATYGMRGVLIEVERSAPISINTSL